jgi:hypothetical protein
MAQWVKQSHMLNDDFYFLLFHTSGSVWRHTAYYERKTSYLYSGIHDLNTGQNIA